MFYDPRRDPHGLPHDPFLALVAPRPIGWISSVSRSGVRNLAPYSYFTALSTKPHVVGFSSTGRKDSLVNAEETGGFVANLVSADLAEAMNRTSASVPPDVDEFDLAGLAAAPSRNVAAPRVAAAHAALECVYLRTIPLVGADGGEARSHLVLGEVVGIHVDETILTGGLVDAARLRYLTRLGYRDYAIVDRVFPMDRPGQV